MWRVGSNVVVSLQIRSAEARRLGVDMHICELQLSLKAFVQEKVLAVPVNLILLATVLTFP